MDRVFYLYYLYVVVCAYAGRGIKRGVFVCFVFGYCFAY